MEDYAGTPGAIQCAFSAVNGLTFPRTLL